MHPARWHAHMAAAIAELLLRESSGMSTKDTDQTYLGMLTAMHVS